MFVVVVVLLSLARIMPFEHFPLTGHFMLCHIVFSETLFFFYCRPLIKHCLLEVDHGRIYMRWKREVYLFASGSRLSLESKKPGLNIAVVRL